MVGVFGGVCCVFFIVILFLFEFIGDYRIILLLMGIVMVVIFIVNLVEMSAVFFSTSDIETRGVAVFVSLFVVCLCDFMRSDIVIIDEEIMIEVVLMIFLRVFDFENLLSCVFVVVDGVFVGVVISSSIADVIV